MKYFVSIILVLLMMNFLAQADVVKDDSLTTTEGAAAAPIKTSDIATKVEPGKYAETMGENKPKAQTQGDKNGKCNDARGGCLPVAQGRSPAKKGVNPAKGGVGDPKAAAAKTVNSTK